MNRLQPGDEIRVLAPAHSWQRQFEPGYRRAQALLEKAGFRVTFSKNIQKQLWQKTAAAADRAADMNAAFADPRVKAIIALRGGWSTNDILPLIDWELVRNNPKPVIGFSDITVLINAIVAQTGGVGYLGPQFSPLSDKRFGQVMLDNLVEVLSGEPVELKPSKEWGLPFQKERYKSGPWRILGKGVAEGVLFGGNLGTIFLGQGTPYGITYDRPYILAVEDDDEAGALTGREFSRRLESILQQPGARQNLRGLLVGRFLPSSKFSNAELAAVIASKRLGDIPIVTNIDIGHTMPAWTLPIGGWARLDTTGKRPVFIVQAKTV